MLGTDWDRRGLAIDTLARATVQDPVWADEWCRERPLDPGAAAVRGWGEVHRAWAARGGGWADGVSGGAFQVFAERLARARGLCERAAELWSDDPTPWVAMLWLTIGQGGSPHEFDRLWDELTARDMDNRLGHNAALQNHCEKWHGSHPQMYAFARGTTAPWAAVVPLQAHIEYVMYEEHNGHQAAARVANFWFDSVEAKTDLDTALSWIHDPGPTTHALFLHDLSVIGYALAQAHRWKEVRALFAQTGNRSYEYPWYYQGDPEAAFVGVLRRAHRRRW